MRDNYSHRPGLPPACLVPPERQPDYLDLPGHHPGPCENVADWLADRHVRAGYGDGPAAIASATGAILTYADLAGRSSRLAVALAGAGLRHGDRVALRCPNVPDLLVLVAGIWKAGGVVVPTSPLARAGELRYFLDDSGARFLFAAAGDRDLGEARSAVAGSPVERVVLFGPDARGEEGIDALLAGPAGAPPRIRADDVAILWYTGGTTGTPKGCYHTHRRFLLAGRSIGAALGVRRGDRWGTAAPVGHALGFIAHTIYTTLHGAVSVFIEDFHSPATVLRAIARHEIGTFTAIAASWARMLEAIANEFGGEFPLPSLRRAFAMWQSASSSEVYDGWRARGVELLNNFGSTAFATWVLAPRPGDIVPRASLGRTAPGYVVRAVLRDADGRLVDAPRGEPGQLAVRGPSGLTYWNRPDFQARDVVEGWTLADDLIRLDAHGNAEYLGRTDFMINTAGHKIAPVEVENVISRHPSVREVGVVGAPDPIRQEVVMAFVALRDGCVGDDRLREELQQYVKSELAPYKYPRRLEFIAALPRDHVGKVQQRVLADWARAGAPGVGP